MRKDVAWCLLEELTQCRYSGVVMKVQKLVQTELRQEKKCHLVTDKKDVVKVCKIVTL